MVGRIDRELLHNMVIDLITNIRDAHPVMVDIFTKGSCYNLFAILASVFPEALAYDNENHLITRIGDRYYDINGEVVDVPDTYAPIAEYLDYQSLCNRIQQCCYTPENKLKITVHGN